MTLDRSAAFATASFLCHFLYALYNGILAITYHAHWLIAMCAFYTILTALRLMILWRVQARSHLSNEKTQTLVTRISGILLSVSAVVLFAAVFLCLSQDHAVSDGKIVMITIATYTFFKLSLAVCQAIKRWNNASFSQKMIQSVQYAELAASMWTLQRSMLASFDNRDWETIQWMHVLTGSVACLFVMMLGISMIMKTKQERSERHGKIKICKDK